MFVTDNGTIATYKLNDLSPIDAVSFPGAYALAGGGANLPLYALSRGSVDSGRLCAVTPQAVSPCAALPFAPSGGGVHRISSGKSVVYVTDRASASVVPYTATKTTVTAGTPIKLPQQPQGDPVAIGSTLYVPVRRGIAVIDTDTGKVLSTIALPVSPLSLVANGKKQLFAALFSTNQVAALTLSKPGATPTIKLIGVQKGPVALASSGGSIYVVNGATDSAQKINPATLAVTTVSKLPVSRLEHPADHRPGAEDRCERAYGHRHRPAPRRSPAALGPRRLEHGDLGRPAPRPRSGRAGSRRRAARRAPTASRSRRPAIPAASMSPCTPAPAISRRWSWRAPVTAAR